MTLTKAKMNLNTSKKVCLSTQFDTTTLQPTNYRKSARTRMLPCTPVPGKFIALNRTRALRANGIEVFN